MPNTNSGYELTWPAENIDQQILKIPGLEAKIGDLSTLTTEQKANLVAAINELVNSVATKTKNSKISASFDTAKVYSAGDYVIYDGDLYRAKEDISAGTWDESKWTLISIGEDLAKKANVDGNYEGLTSGYANNLTPMSANDGVVQEAAFISQGTGTGNNLVSVDTSSVAQLLEKSGNTVSINQYITTNFQSQTINGVTFTNNGDGTWTINGTATETAQKSIASQSSLLTVGERVLFGFVNLQTAVTGLRLLDAWSSIRANTMVVSNAVNANYEVRIEVTGGTAVNNVKVFPIFVRLDRCRFSSAIIADLTANPSHFSWYYNGSLAYNPGSLENSTGRYLVCTKRNLVGGDYETGSIDNASGLPVPNAQQVRTKDYKVVIPNSRLYITRFGTDAARIYFYDKDKNFISTQTASGSIITVPSNAVFYKDRSTGSYGPTYNNDHDVSLYYSASQGGEGYDQHYPYEEPFVCDTGAEELLAFDWKEPNGTIHRDSDEIDFGDLTWVKYEHVSLGTYFYATITDLNCQRPVSFDQIPDAICSKYRATGRTASLLTDGSFTFDGDATQVLQIQVKDSKYQDAASFKSGNTGTKLQFLLKESTRTTTQSTPYNPNLTVDDYGMMYWLDANGNLVSVPQPCKVSYNTDYKGSLDTLIKHANGDMTDVALNSEMEEALSNKASIEDVFTHVTITDSTTTLGDVKSMLDEINANGEHVFFDTYALGANTYVCTILIDADAGIYKMFDVVGHRVTEGVYDPDKLLVVVLANLDNIASQKQINNLQEQIDELGGSSLIKDYAVLKQKIADGTSTDAVSPGDKIDINWIDTVTGSTNKGNTVTCSDEWQFAKGVGECEERQYLFVYDGSSWTYNEEQITLSDFGLSVTGTPSVGEVMTITTTVKTVNFTFTGYDKSVPHSSDIHHNWTLEQTYAPDTRIYDTYECLFTLAAGKTLAAGSYKLTNYSHRSGANLTVYFTLSSAVSNTGSSVIQFASLGYVLSGSYYIPSSMRAYQLASDTALTGTITVSMTEISGATDVSTVDGVVLPGSFDFAVFGNNNWALSNVRQHLNDESKTGTYTPSTNFDRPNAANRGKGWLYGIDPRAYDLIIGVDNKFTAGYGNDGYTQNQTYTSTDKVFLLSMKEMSFNINTAEGELLDLYGEYTNNTLTNDAVAARAKYNKAGGTLNSYRWSRSAIVYYAGFGWGVYSSGSYGSYNAYNAFYVAPAFCFGA